MKRITTLVCFVLALAFSLIAFAGDDDIIYRVHDGRVPGIEHSGVPGAGKAARDTFVLVGPPSLGPLVDGTFQDAGGAPSWNGWSGMDWTVVDTTDTTWHVSDYYVINGAYSAYCGDESIPSCGPGDPVGGADNNWVKMLKWGAKVADRDLTTNISVSFAFDVDTEPGYDYGILARELENEEREDIWQLAGDSLGTVTVPVTYVAGEYFGDDEDEIGIWFVGETDTGASDGDCRYPSTGIWRIDDVVITADNGAGGMSHDFEDGTLGDLERKFLGAVGDFTHILAGLGDPDLCVSNGTPQITFIDDGVVQPLTGGSFATSDNRKYAWGYVVNYTGGLSFSDQRKLRNTAITPVMAWGDATHDGCRVGFTVMQDNFYLATETGMYYEWWIRSVDTGVPADVADAAWQHSPFVYTGGPFYSRPFWDCSDALVQGRTHVQLGVGVMEYPTVNGTNGSPAPYIDNVRLESYPYEGPSMSTQTLHLAQDAFPEIGIVDTADLGRNSIRFDQAENISPPDHEWYYNGDSVTIDVVAVRTGAALTGRPLMHYKLQTNPLFDPYRTAGLPDSGVVVMDSAYTPAGTWVRDGFCVDLPDTGFLFPGDILHYYFSAEDAIGGPGGTDPFTSTLPADIDGWGDFSDPTTWTETYSVNGLPSVIEDPLNPGEYKAPEFLFWDDAESERRGTKNEWYSAFANLGWESGVDYDVYYGQAPSSGVGSGLGSRASTNQLNWYNELVYSSCYLTTTTFSNGDWDNGGADDITRLENWLDLGNKDMFITGNGVCFDLNQSGAATVNFLNNRMGVTFVADTHRDLLGGQLAPRVLVVSGNGVVNTVSSYIAYGGCPQLWDFDLVTPAGSTRLAEYANASGTSGGYPYSALTLNTLGTGSRLITLTSDLAYVETDADEGAKADAKLSARVRLLKDVMAFFGKDSNPGNASDVPVAARFAVQNAPNPFNPVTKISYSIRAPGHMTLKVFNIRGELVRTLIDGRVDSDGVVEWNGTDDRGGRVSSGVYFARTQMGNDVLVNKMALVK